MPDLTPEGVKAALQVKYLRLVENLRVPLIFVVADTTSSRAWYLWLQGWLVDQRRIGRTIQSFGDTVTVHIPAGNTLEAGLQGPLKEIARWENENQMVLSLKDTMRTAVATRNEKVLLSLATLIGSVDENSCGLVFMVGGGSESYRPVVQRGSTTPEKRSKDSSVQRSVDTVPDPAPLHSQKSSKYIKITVPGWTQI